MIWILYSTYIKILTMPLLHLDVCSFAIALTTTHSAINVKEYVWKVNALVLCSWITTFLFVPMCSPGAIVFLSLIYVEHSLTTSMLVCCLVKWFSFLCIWKAFLSPNKSFIQLVTWPTGWARRLYCLRWWIVLVDISYSVPLITRLCMVIAEFLLYCGNQIAEGWGFPINFLRPCARFDTCDT